MKVTTAWIKGQIVTWLTPEELARIARQFDPQQQVWHNEAALKTPSNWARETKSRERDGTIERVFDFRPFEQQLRLYVYTTADDSAVLRYVFQGE